MEFACFGLSFIGTCKYDPSAPANIYFTLGDAVAALSITLLIPQFLKPVYTLRLAIRRFPISHIYSTVFLGSFAVLIAAILPNLGAQKWLGILGYPIFWEIVGASLFAIAYASLAYAFIKPAPIRPGALQKYAGISAEIISQGNERDYIDLIEDLEFNMPALSRAASRPLMHRRTAFYDFTYRNQLKDASYASALLHIISDPHFCSTLVSRAPWRAAKIIQILSDRTFSSAAAKRFVQELFRQSILTSQSMIGRESEYVGFRAAPILSKALYENDFCNHYYEPFGGLNHKDFDKIDLSGIRKINYASALNIKAAFEADNCWDAMNWKRMQECYSSIFDRVKNIRGNSSEEIYFRIEVKSGVCELIKLTHEYLSKQEGETLKGLYQSPTRSFDDNIIAEVAEIAFDAISSIANNFDGWDDPFWNYALGILRDVFDSPAKPPADITPLQQRVLLMLGEKLKENMEEALYPALMRVLIAYVGPYKVRVAGSKQDASSILQDMTYFEIKKLKALSETHPEASEKFLPKTVSFDKLNNILTFHFRFSGSETTDLNTIDVQPPSLEYLS